MIKVNNNYISRAVTILLLAEFLAIMAPVNASGLYFGRAIRKMLRVTLLSMIATIMLGAASAAFAETNPDPSIGNENKKAAIQSLAEVVLTETNEPLSTGGELSSGDPDNPQTFVAQKNVAGTYGTFNINASGAWTYVTKSALDELKEGQSVSDSFSVSIADGTTTTVKVTINGTNDPAILGSADVVIYTTNAPLTSIGKLTIKDVDSPETFVAEKVGNYGSFDIKSTGAWAYVTKDALANLKLGQSVSDSFTVSSADGTTTTVKVTIMGNNRPATLSSADVVLTETNEPLSTSGKLTIADTDKPTFVAQSKTAGTYGTFDINSAGAWTYTTKSALDEFKEGQSVVDSFTVTSADGTTTTVKVTINGTNDPAILTTADVVLKETNEPLKAHGKLTIKDVDSPETFIEQNKVGSYGTFNINSAGEWTYVAKSAFDELKEGQTISDSFTVSSADGTTTTVKVTIKGTNDPAVLSSADVVLTETDEPLRASGKLTIKDVDSPETFVPQKKVGSYGTFNINSAGEWTYATKSALDELKEGQSVIDSFTVSSADGTTTTMKVTINGTNDPAILKPAHAVLNTNNPPLSTGGKLTIKDVDSPETFIEQNKVGSYGTFNINNAGEWTYVANSTLEGLKAGQSVGDSFTVTSADGTTTTVRITINSGTNIPAILGAADVVLTETNVPLKAKGKLTIKDVDSPQTFVAQSNVAGDYGIFNINSAGAWTYVTKSALDNLKEGQSISDSFTVSSADGTTTTVKVTINGTNDPAILSSADIVLTETNAPLSTGGTLTIMDVDSPETFVAQKMIDSHGTFNIDASGAWTYVTNGALDYLKEGQSVSDILTVSSADGTTTTIKVTIKGTNDPAILSAADVVLTETNAPLSTGGTLTITDVDSPESFVAQKKVGNYGTFNINSSGEWTYSTKSALDELKEGESVGDTFTVASADGTTTTVKITIKGTNDPAVLSSADVVLIETNEPLSAGGKLTIKDVDSPETFVAQSKVAGTYGIFNIDTSGTWAYVTKSALDELNFGQGVTDSFTVASADGTTTTVKVTIDGTNDPAVLSAADEVLIETNEPLSTGGKLTIKDVDSPETFEAQSNVSGTYGTFNINSTGEWTYVTKSALDELNVGEGVSDSFIVSSADGTTTTVKVTIDGTNDPAILGAADVVLIEANEPLSASGKLTIKDVDSPETFEAQSDVVGTYGTFNIDASGSWTYVTKSALDELNVGQGVSDSFTVTSADGTTTTVKVTIDGTNDPAILSAADVSLNETNVPLKTSGTLTIKDVDSPETFVPQRMIAGKNGIFNINSAGAWTYAANSNFDYLNVGQSVSDSFTVFSADGTPTTVKVTINGTNDPAILSAADVVLKQTNTPLRTGGKLNIRDVDSPQTFVAQNNVAGTNGIFNIDSFGVWTYVTNDALDDLSVGRSAADIFTVTSSDGTTTTVRITVIGTANPTMRK